MTLNSFLDKFPLLVLTLLIIGLYPLLGLFSPSNLFALYIFNFFNVYYSALLILSLVLFEVSLVNELNYN